jgi:outer membrane receptor for ferrienterochelin and colicins
VFIRLAAWSLIVSVSSLPRTAFADPPRRAPEPTNAESEGEVVVTGTRTEEQAARSTLATKVVTKAEAERRGATNVAEALAGEPGLSVNPNAYSHLGSPSGVQIQGLDAERVLVMRDGERVVGDFGGVIDLSAYPLADIERIEVVSGPTSSLYGTGALGGVVNIVSGPPVHPGTSMSGRAEKRSSHAVLAEGTVSERFDSSWATLSASYQQQDGVRLFDDLPDLAIPNQEKLVFDARLGHQGERLDSLVSGSFGQERARGLLSEELPVLGRFEVGLPEQTQRYSLRNVERLRLTDTVEVSSSVGAQWFRNRASRDRVASPLDEDRFRKHEQQSAELSARIGRTPTRFMVGLRFEREAFTQSLVRIGSNDGELATSEREEVAPVELRSGAAYAQLIYEPSEDATVVPGVRAELHDRFGYVVAPRLAASWFPTEELQLRASAGTGFRAPSAKEFGFFFDHSSLGYRVVGNPDLAPERSIGGNADVRYRVSENFGVRAGTFYNWVFDLITTEFSGRAEAGVDDFGYVNVGHARTAGVEPSAWWRLDSTLYAEFAYSYLFTRNDDSDEPLPSRPPHTVTTSLRYRPVGDLEFVLRQRSVSPAFVAESLFSPAFSLLDVRAAYDVGAFQSYVAVHNALDVHDDPMRPADQRPTLGRVFVVGVLGTWPSE